MTCFKYFFQLMRPAQWLKNLLLFFPPFLSGSLISFEAFAVVGISSYISFCSISSASYVFNDLCDKERDSTHPVKRLRPIPSGKVTTSAAIVLALILLILGVSISIYASEQILLFLLFYGFITIVYSVWLKRFPIVDLFCISVGFLIRLETGGAIFKVEISEWLFLSVLFLSLFLSAGKRLAEQNLMGDKAAEHRLSLNSYPDGILDAIIHVTAATVLVTYTMYTLAHPQLIYTVPLCTFGLFRYILRIKSGHSGDPTESLLKDVPLLCVSALWMLLVGWSIYR